MGETPNLCDRSAPPMTSSISSSSSVFDNLRKAQLQVRTSSNRLSSGKRINTAADDAAGLAIAEQLGVRVSVGQVASQNSSYAQSAISIAEGAIGQIGDITSRLSELAAQAANGTLSDAQRSSLQQEYTALRDEATRIVETTQFNGQSLLSASSGTSYQIGPDGTSNSQIQGGENSVSTLISNLPSSISSQGDAQGSLDALGTFQARLSEQQGSLGATSSRLQYAEAVNQETIINSQAAKARIEDADVASEVSNLISGQLKTSSATSVSGIMQEAQKNVMATIFKGLKV
jgi:flagellin